MARTEDGEMELVLGNKQLLSVLFVLVVLLGVFFTMGYIVGRNNPSEEKIRVAAAKAQISAAAKVPPTVIEPNSGTPGRPSPAPVEQPVAEQGPVTVEPSRKEISRTEPAQPAKPETKKEEPARKEEKKAELKKEERKEPPAPAKPAPPVESAGTVTATPPPGMYLQVAAIDKPGAGGMVEAYRKQGFTAQITPSSSPTLFRVMIGPLKNNEEVAQTKQKLKQIGVEGAILRKF
jgi:cell division protein FtsN